MGRWPPASGRRPSPTDSRSTLPLMPPVSRKRSARLSRKRRRKVALRDNDLLPEQWLAIQEAWGGCAYCGASDRALQKDTVLAISRGGSYTLANVVPACASCNASKGNDEVTGWLRRKRLDERAFLLRHIELGAQLTERFAAEPEA